MLFPCKKQFHFTPRPGNNLLIGMMQLAERLVINIHRVGRLVHLYFDKHVFKTLPTKNKT